MVARKGQRRLVKSELSYDGTERAPVQIRLDRSLPIALTVQIQGQIVYAISTGMLHVGERLPSVRELAATLKVAPMTVSRVYRHLAQQGVVYARPGDGTFVAELAYPGGRIASGSLDTSLEPIIGSWMHQTTNASYARENARGESAEHRARLKAFERTDRVIWMVGNFRPATEAYAQEIEAVLGDLQVSVRPVLLDELRASLLNAPELIETVALVITVPTRLPEVRALLESRNCQVAAVAFRVSTDTRRLLTAVLPTERVGIISSYPEFLQTIVDEVGLYCLTQASPLSAVLGQDERIRHMLRQIEVLVLASGSEAILDLVPDTVRAFELRHAPDPDSVHRLRPFLAT